MDPVSKPWEHKVANSTLRDVSHTENLNGRNFPQWRFGIYFYLQQSNLVTLVEEKEEISVEVLVPTDVIFYTAFNTTLSDYKCCWCDHQFSSDY